MKALIATLIPSWFSHPGNERQVNCFASHPDCRALAADSTGHRGRCQLLNDQDAGHAQAAFPEPHVVEMQLRLSRSSYRSAIHLVGPGSMPDHENFGKRRQGQVCPVCFRIDFMV